MMKRRTVLKAMAAGAAVPVSALGANQDIPYVVDAGHPEVLPVVHQLFDLGEPVKAMTVYRDKIFVATEHGKIFQISMGDF